MINNEICKHNEGMVNSEILINELNKVYKVIN